MHVSFYKLKYTKLLHFLWSATNITEHHSASLPLTHPTIPHIPQHPKNSNETDRPTTTHTSLPSYQPTPSSAPHCPVQRVGRPKAASDHSPAPPRRQQPECRLSTNASLGGRGAGRWGPGIGHWREGGRGCGRSSRLSLYQAQIKAILSAAPRCPRCLVNVGLRIFTPKNVISDIIVICTIWSCSRMQGLNEMRRVLGVD